MPREPWLLIDANNLAHRAFHAIQGMQYDGQQTAVLYGFLRDIALFRRDFGSSNFVFCFDHGINKRKELYPQYKGKRPYITDPIMKKGKEDCEKQIDLLKCSLLKELGFKNIFYENGYEADDLIAESLYSIPKKERSVIISGDRDLYQLLEQDSVCQYSPTPKKTHTQESFTKEWGVTPDVWHRVKAIAGENGDSSDNIPGALRIGYTLAAKYVAGKMPNKGKNYERISEFITTEQYKINLRLITLPYDGCPKIEPKEQGSFPIDNWDEICRRYGMFSLLGARVTTTLA